MHAYVCAPIYSLLSESAETGMFEWFFVYVRESVYSDLCVQRPEKEAESTPISLSASVLTGSLTDPRARLEASKPQTPSC